MERILVVEFRDPITAGEEILGYRKHLVYATYRGQVGIIKELQKTTGVVIVDNADVTRRLNDIAKINDVVESEKQLELLAAEYVCLDTGKAKEQASPEIVAEVKKVKTLNKE